MRVGYARPSGGLCDTGEVQGQVDALRAHGCTKVIVEEPNASRNAAPKLNEALKNTEPGDVLVIYGLAALAVSMRAFIASMQLIQSAGIKLISITDHLDTTAPEGTAVFALVGAVAALVDEDDGPKFNKPAKTKTNNRSGRPKALSHEEFELARRLMTKTNMTMAEIAQRLNVAPATLYRYFPGGRNAVSDDA